VKRVCFITFVAISLVPCAALAQMLRYDQHREIEPPESATLKLGPFLSNLSFSQTAGFRYTRSEGTGTDFLYGNNRGVIKSDGSEYPLVSKLVAQNYIMISRHMDLDISFSLGYAIYPKDTQEDEFFFDMAEEGVSGSISTEFYITRFVRGTLSDDIVYRTDYIDIRGSEDNYGGSSYEHLQNTVKLNADWLMDEDKNLGVSISRNDLIVMDDEFEAQEHYSWQEQIYYEQQLAAFLVGGARAELNQTEYNVDTRAGSALQGYSVYANARLTRNSSAGLSLGYNTGSSDDLIGGSVDSMSATASLSTQMSREWSHGMNYQYGLTGGFSSPFNLQSSLSYELSYENDMASMVFSSGYTSVEPQVAEFSDYTSWLSSLNIGLPMTRSIGLLFSASYAARANGVSASTDLSDPEYTSDYDTLSLRLGTSFSVTRRIDFTIYAQHIDRMSDNENLDYSRDILAGTFSFSHAF
jgi:hypothetical protein